MHLLYRCPWVTCLALAPIVSRAGAPPAAPVLEQHRQSDDPRHSQRSPATFAEEPVDGYEPVVWTTDVGGPRKSVSAFAQSPDGFLWLLNAESLSRFDGVEFQSLALEELPDGMAPVAMWSDATGFRVAAVGGAVWDWREGRFSLVLPAQPGAARSVLVWGQSDGSTIVLAADGHGWRCRPGQAVNGISGEALPVSGGGAWLPGGAGWWGTTNGRLAQMTAAGAAVVPLPAGAGAVRGLAAPSPAAVWAATDHALLHWSGTAFESLPPPAGRDEWRVKWLQEGAGETVWMESNHSLWVLRDGQWNAVPVDWPLPAGLGVTSVDTAGNFWYADQAGHLSAVRPDGKEITLHGIGELHGGTVDSLFSDREGNTWAGISRVGLVQFKRQRFRSLTAKDGLPAPMVWTVCEDGDGAIWFAGEAPFMGRWHEGRLAVFDKDNGSLPGQAGALWHDAGGHLLAGFTGIGLMRGDAGAFQKELPSFRPVPGGHVHFVFDDSRGRRWVEQAPGVLLTEGESTTHLGTADGLGGSPQRSIAEDAAGRVWVGSASGGAAWFEDGKFHPVGTAQGLPPHAVYALCGGADGSLWIGTVGGGLARWREGRITIYTKTHGLPDDRIMQLIEDGAGFLWAGTRAGLARISLASLDAVERREAAALEVVTFDRSDGLPTREMSGGKQPAVWKSGDGLLWFATTGGLASCDPKGISMNRVAPVPQILDARLDGHPVVVEAQAGAPFHALESGTRAVDVPPGPHSLELRWTAPCLISGNRMRYSYRMDGVEREWSPLAAQSAATYGTLPPGSYRFLVRACNHDGTWSAVPAALSVVVHPQWWQRTGVRLGGALLGAALLSLGIWAAVRARHRRHLAQAELRRVRETERARIARDLHDDLGSSLTEISMLATTVPGLSGGPEMLPGKLSAISGKARALVTALDEIVWAVNPRHDTADSLASYLTGFTRDLLTAANIDYSFDVPSPLPDLPLGAEPRHSLFLAFKEVLHNIVRHSGATHVKLTLRTGGGELTISVEDNGRGLPPDQPEDGDGLRNIGERLRCAGGECLVDFNGSMGTTVRLRLPLTASNA